MGFTPAYAGNTLERAVSDVGTEVHPRIRGEYRLRMADDLNTSGSPPHTRGIPAKRQIVKALTRFTPAYAGNTLRL